MKIILILAFFISSIPALALKPVLKTAEEIAEVSNCIVSGRVVTSSEIKIGKSVSKPMTLSIVSIDVEKIIKSRQTDCDWLKDRVDVIVPTGHVGTVDEEYCNVPSKSSEPKTFYLSITRGIPMPASCPSWVK